MKVGFVFILCLFFVSTTALSANKSKQKDQKESLQKSVNEHVERKQKKTHIQKWNCSEKQWEEFGTVEKNEDSKLSKPDAYTKILVWNQHESQWVELKK